jgi:hypothetical protein
MEEVKSLNARIDFCMKSSDQIRFWFEVHLNKMVYHFIYGNALQHLNTTPY